jgi:hypothetical protein
MPAPCALSAALYAPGRPQPAAARVVDPRVDKLKMVCKAAGITISPNIYKQVRGVGAWVGGWLCG